MTAQDAETSAAMAQADPDGTSEISSITHDEEQAGGQGAEDASTADGSGGLKKLVEETMKKVKGMEEKMLNKEVAFESKMRKSKEEAEEKLKGELKKQEEAFEEKDDSDEGEIYVHGKEDERRTREVWHG